MMPSGPGGRARVAEQAADFRAAALTIILARAWGWIDLFSTESGTLDTKLSRVSWSFVEAEVLILLSLLI
jgi:hypothetical protein